MTKKYTPITKLINGYQVVIVQEAKVDGAAGAYLGCLLLTPDNPVDGCMMLLGDAMKEYKARTDKHEGTLPIVAPVQS